MEIRDLTDLSPTEFEHFVFDLVRASGIRNLVWRSPGADGGRDIEGVHTEFDFSGSFFLEKWYIEAKRHKNSIDWPTVWEKVSYAQNASAHFLLIVATTTFSPKCIDEISQWNQRGSLPRIRCWPKPELEYRLKIQPSVGIKYGLLEASTKLVPAMAPLSQHLAKCTMATQEAYAVSGTLTPYLECAAAFAELLLIRSNDITQSGKIIRRGLTLKETWYSWLTLESPNTLDDEDVPSIRAIACAIKLITGALSLHISKKNTGLIHIIPIEPRRPDLDLGIDLINTLLLWGDLELFSTDTGIAIFRRSEPN